MQDGRVLCRGCPGCLWVFMHQIQAPLRSSDGSTLLTDKEAILQRWSEHFEGLLSDRRTVQESSLAKIAQVDLSWSWMTHPLVERSGEPQCS